MKSPVIVFAAYAGLLVAGLLAGCSSGTGGTAAIPFDPFGSESPPASTEPTSGGNESPPGPGATTIKALCEYDCQRFATACPGTDACDASTCSQLESAFPGCSPELQVYLACIAKAPIVCGPYGGTDIPSCQAASDSFSTCVNGGYYLRP